MKLFSKKRPLCEVHTCSNFLDKDPVIVFLDEHEFKICDECSTLLDTITTKFDEREDDVESI